MDSPLFLSPGRAGAFASRHALQASTAQTSRNEAASAHPKRRSSVRATAQTASKATTRMVKEAMMPANPAATLTGRVFRSASSNKAAGGRDPTRPSAAPTHMAPVVPMASASSDANSERQKSRPVAHKRPELVPRNCIPATIATPYRPDEAVCMREGPRRAAPLGKRARIERRAPRYLVP